MKMLPQAHPPVGGGATAQERTISSILNEIFHIYALYYTRREKCYRLLRYKSESLS